MSFLTEQCNDTFAFEKMRWGVNPAYDTVLEIQKLFKEELPQSLKVEQALRMLLFKGQKKLWLLSEAQKAALLDEIYKRYIHLPQRPAARQQLPVLDFEEDGAYIYASFLMDYGIDLIDMQGKLPWKKFIALFHGLSERTKIREVMRIRSMKLPAYNGKNGEQIRELQELKSYYALPVKGNGRQKGLDALFSTLEGMASAGKRR